MDQIAPIEVGLPVIDLDNMLSFYRDVLSCEEMRRADIPPELSQAIKTSASGYINVWLRTPNGEVIKLVSPPQSPQRAERLEQSSERTGFAYLTFYCSDLDEVLTAAEARGATVRSDRALLSGDIGLKMVFFEDPEGNVIELVEPVADPRN